VNPVGGKKVGVTVGEGAGVIVEVGGSEVEVGEAGQALRVGVGGGGSGVGIGGSGVCVAEGRENGVFPLVGDKEAGAGWQAASNKINNSRKI
jgi:hypothetical protein